MVGIIFTAQQLQNAQEQNNHHYLAFINVIKVLDAASQPIWVWSLMEKFSYPSFCRF